MSVVDIFDNRIIDFNMEVSNKDEALNLLADKLMKAGYIENVEEFLEDIYLRESEGFTGIGEGIAIPHGKSSTVTNIGIAIGKCNKPIEWETLDEKPVEIIFLFCVSKEQYRTEHLKMLADLAGRLGRGNTISKLKSMQTYEELVQAFVDDTIQTTEDMEELTEEINIVIE